MKLRNKFLCFAFLILLDVCLFGTLCGFGEPYGRSAAVADRLSEEIPPIVALTFDDGPDHLYTERLLDGLAERNVKATFFLIGRNIDGNEALVKRMSDEGHLIGNHTYNHVRLSRQTQAVDLEEIEMTNQKIFEITGVTPTYVRPPFGDRNMDLEWVVDMTSIMWDIDPSDWKVKNKDKIVSHVLQNVKDNDIILLHDVYGTTVEAVFKIIDKLQADGWQFVTVDELMTD